LLVGVGDLRAKPPSPTFNIVVEVQNAAAVTHPILRQAEHQDSRVFGKMAVHIEWRAPTTTLRRSAIGPPFTVVLMSRDMGAAKIRNDGVLPGSLATASRVTGRAYVFFERVEQAAQRYGGNTAPLLARVLTHELGHLIADIGHQHIGAMRPSIDLREPGFFGFTVPQQLAIRAALAQAMSKPVPMLALRGGAP
jgi:hypothetical protein